MLQSGYQTYKSREARLWVDYPLFNENKQLTTDRRTPAGRASKRLHQPPRFMEKSYHHLRTGFPGWEAGILGSRLKRQPWRTASSNDLANGFALLLPASFALTI